MSVGTKLLQAAAGGASDPVYVDDVFSTDLWSGNDTARNIVTGLDMSGEGGMAWVKRRNGSTNPLIYDTARGTYHLETDGAGAQSSFSGFLTGFNNNGFSVGTAHNMNGSGADMCAWSFRKAEKFFDVVTYTGNGTAGRTISHNLDSVPGMIIIKRTDSSADWIVWHRAIRSSSPENFYVKLNSNAAEVFGSFFDGGSYSNVLPTSTQITLGDTSAVNASSGTYVMYLFAHNEQEFGENSDEAIIKCGSFTGNTASVDLGFEPQWVMFKRTDSATGGDWHIYDIMRGLHAPDADDALLYANNTNAESLTSRRINLTSTGFDQTTNLYSGATYIYMAIARPHKPASEFAATDLWTTDTRGSVNSDEPGFRSTFPVDMAFWDTGVTTANAATRIADRFRGPNYLLAHNSGAESGGSTVLWDYQNGWLTSTGTSTNIRSWMWRRAKGFFDVVAYKSNTTYPNTFNHNLGVVPEIVIIKRRDGSSGWTVYTSVTGNDRHLVLSSDAAQSSAGQVFWNSTTPTSTVVHVSGQDETWGYNGYDYIAYLFASVSGISKIGSYTGTGSDLNVDCGFSAGARFVLIKRIDSTGHWYIYDSARGIVAGNDPYILLNSNAAENSSTDYIDPLNAGFTITSSAPAELNASGGTYLFYAIA